MSTASTERSAKPLSAGGRPAVPRDPPGGGGVDVMDTHQPPLGARGWRHERHRSVCLNNAKPIMTGFLCNRTLGASTGL
jgi:hypothetical protein